MMHILIITIAPLLIFSHQMKVLRSHLTVHYHIRYEQKIGEKNIIELGKLFEECHARYREKFGITLKERADVYVYATEGRFKLESNSRVFKEGSYADGRIYLAYQGSRIISERMRSTVSRVVSRKLLENIPSCPDWLAEAYSFFAGDELKRLGEPAQVNMSTFADLNEEYGRSNTTKGVGELYAKLAATIGFLINRYGDKKVESMFNKFMKEDSLEKVFEDSFGEKIDAIEEAWIKDLRPRRRGK